MSDAKPDGSAERDPLELLADEFVERQRRGESPSIEEYASKHPELADAIRELFPTVTAIERVKARGERSPGGLASLGPVKLERLGDYRLVREIGRGGMGIVYEAEQESLGRRVAVKVLPRQSLLEAEHLARFQREAQVAAGLHHTNIVQVYGVGEQEGFHYFVMQYVRGVGLDRVIRRLRALADSKTERTDDLLDRVCRRLVGPQGMGPDYFRSVARIGMQAADALHYAHSQGTLHRDIKPGNLLLDDEGVVWVTDFGLARTSHSENVTSPGEVTGTLRYVAPERFRGEAGASGDIYGLGLALYEMLTLRPAFEDIDQTRLIRRITQETPAPPSRLNARIPRDLETIVLKAVAHEPAQRYASAEAMADDLRRFLEDRPVEARRVGAAERLWRWCRRNKAVASLSGATLVLIVAVAAVATVGYVRTKQALEREAEQHQKAEAVSELASQAIDRVFDRLAPIRTTQPSELTVTWSDNTTVRIPRQLGPSKETAALLEEMLPFYDRLAAQTGEDAQLRRRTAEANRRVGDIRTRLGQYDKAEAAYTRAIALSRELADGPVRTAEALNELGRVRGLKGKPDDARNAYLEAQNVLTSAFPTSRDSAPAAVRFELARTWYLLGTRLPPEPGARPPGPGGGGPPRATGGGTPPVPPPRSRPSRDPGSPPPPPKAGDRKGPGPSREAEREYLDKAVTLLTGLLQDEPRLPSGGQASHPEYRHLLALCCRERSRVFGPDDRAAAAKALAEATEILASLVRDFPQTPDYRFDLSETYAMVDGGPVPPGPDRVGTEGGRATLSAAEERLRKALAISEGLVAEYPGVPEYLASQAHIHHRLGEVFRRMRRLDEAEQSDRRAVTVQASLVANFPELTSQKAWLAAFRNSLADTLLVRDKLSEARALSEETISTTSALSRVSRDPEMWYLHALLADSNRTLSAVLRRSGQPDLADKAAREAEMHRQALRENPPPDRPPRKGPPGGE